MEANISCYFHKKLSSFTILQDEAPSSNLTEQYDLKAPAENEGPAFIFSN